VGDVPRRHARNDALSMNRQAHWDRIYTTKASDAVSWFEPEPITSLRLIDAAMMTSGTCVIDIGGGNSHLVDRLVDRGLRCVFVLDVSEAALALAKARLAARGTCVRWIQADVTGEWDEPVVDIWHDRAVFHFLTAIDDRRRYVEHVRRAVKGGGAVIMAAFALDGPETCSGLPVVRYSPETLSAELGSEFRLVESQREGHRTPSGGMQPFCYARFTRL